MRSAIQTYCLVLQEEWSSKENVLKFLNFGICREQDQKCFFAERQHVRRITSEIPCSGYSIQILLNLILVISLTQLRLERFV